MRSQNLSKPDEAIEFCDADFISLAALAKREFGLDLAESKKPLVYSRISKRLKVKGLQSFSEYLQLIESGKHDERQALISALTTNVTSFFREKHHFETLATEVLRPKASEVDQGGRLRIWSAGCSTGQEPYSIAMEVLLAIPTAPQKDVRILATDIDPKVIEKARTGLYPSQEGEALSANGYQRFAEPQPDQSIALKEDVKGLITFAELNLMETWPFQGPFDAIFCRNVAIYFDHDTQKNLWHRFAQLVKPEGYLFIGHSERLSGLALEQMIPSGITTYKKIPPSVHDKHDGNAV